MSKEEDLLQESLLRHERLVYAKYPAAGGGIRANPPNIDLMSRPARGAVDASRPFAQSGNAAIPLAHSDTPGNTVQIVATAKSTMILPADPYRRFLYFLNNDAVAYATLAFGVDATLVTGMRLGSGGGGILLDNNVPRSAIFIIGSSASNANITLVYA